MAADTVCTHGFFLLADRFRGSLICDLGVWSKHPQSVAQIRRQRGRAWGQKAIRLPSQRGILKAITGVWTNNRICLKLRSVVR
jgi:hypothetical protein